MKCCDNVGDPSYFPTPLPDCLYHVYFSRYLPLSLEVVEKPNKCKSFFGPQFLGEGWPQLFYGILLARPTVHRLTKRGWVAFADLRQRSLEMKCMKCGIYGGWVKSTVQFEAVCGPKFISLWGDCSRPLIACNALACLCTSYFIP